MEPLHYRSAAELISDLKNGELTSVDVTQAFLNRIRQCNDTINAVVTLDEEKALDKALDKAREAGIGWGLIRNTTHQGAMGYYVEMAAKQNMAGIALVCNPPNMAPTGARSAGVHNSPLAIGVPAQERPPILFDMATSVAAHGKIGVAIDKGVSIPDDWAIDAEGNPTTDPKKARVLLPAGGYKGYGLALMFECLSSVMMGNPLLGPCLHDQDPAPPDPHQMCRITH